MHSLQRYEASDTIPRNNRLGKSEGLAYECLLPLPWKRRRLLEVADKIAGRGMERGGGEGSKVKTTGQIISVFQRRKGFPFASRRDRNRKHLEPRRGKVRSERGNNSVGGNRFKEAVSAEND